MRNYFRKALYLVVIAGFNGASAGSYEDFFTYIQRDNGRALAELINRGFDPNTLNPDGEHGLLLALKQPSLTAVEALVASQKTKVEVRNKVDESPLMLAALQGNTALVKKLIERGADVNKPGWSPLHYAATHGHLDAMNLLLENHAYIDAESPNGTTPLMMAAHYGSPQAVKLLLQAGADPQLKNQLGLSAIDFAYRGSRQDSAELIQAAIRSTQPKGKW